MTQPQQPVDPYAWRAPGPPPAPVRPRNRTGMIVLLIVSVLAACGAGVAFGSFIAQPQAGAPTTPVEASATHAPASARAVAEVPTIEDGVWTIGVDFPAGSYRTTANVSSRCYWEISKTGGAGVMDIVQNDLPGGGRPQVTLKRGQTFKTDNCGKWRKV